MSVYGKIGSSRYTSSQVIVLFISQLLAVNIAIGVVYQKDIDTTMDW